MCPTDAQGNNRDCFKAPRVINDSLGKKGDFMDEAIAAWRAAGIIPVFAVGIIPVFAVGNSCFSCASTTMFQAELPNVISVGSTDQNDALMIDSCKGPTPTGLIKPELSAPGVRIRSAAIANDA
ncbi:hypothetical protein ATCC90586_007004 [Pythium insidiosum]|nr:hypothetical protein ATCC90586_007004 [Pythium insidiosum]